MDWYFAPFFCSHIIDTHLENSGNICTPESAGSPDFEDCNPGCGKSCIQLLKTIGEKCEPPVSTETSQANNVLEG